MTIIDETVAAPGVAQGASTPGTSGTMLALRALAIAMRGQEVPTRLDSAQSRRRLNDIHMTQAEAGWRQLKARYHRLAVAAREFQVASLRAAEWVDELVDRPGCQRPYPPARLALISSLARWLIVDGPAITEEIVDRCRAAVSVQPSDDDM